MEKYVWSFSIYSSWEIKGDSTKSMVLKSFNTISYCQFKIIIDIIIICAFCNHKTLYNSIRPICFSILFIVFDSIKEAFTILSALFL
jgi:hypothetical protein